MLFDNTVENIQTMLTAMDQSLCLPEFECFDMGMVRSVGMFLRAGMTTQQVHYNFVMGVASGMPVDNDVLELLLCFVEPAAPWQCTLIGREEIRNTHQRTAELGGMLRSGVEDTFCLPNGARATGNGPLIVALATGAENAGRKVASPSETRELLGLAPS